MGSLWHVSDAAEEFCHGIVFYPAVPSVKRFNQALVELEPPSGQFFPRFVGENG